jgi:hypothetical protein
LIVQTNIINIKTQTYPTALQIAGSTSSTATADPTSSPTASPTRHNQNSCPEIY